MDRQASEIGDRERFGLERLNLAAPVVIGDYVWVGVGALISKGTVIPDDCVVGAKSSSVKHSAKPALFWRALRRASFVKRDINSNRGRKRRF